MFYKYRALACSNKQTIAKHYGIKNNELLERHYYCWYLKFVINKLVGNYR